ncbi:MAG TPA: hypothetical protein VLE23_04805 [Geminicoccaceae bacterium]|nr:hypothetical protein [Geminicoccaceae bacterium]
MVATAVLAALLIGTLATANYRLAPLRYSPAALAQVVETLAGGSNHAVFDLNLDMRELRRQHIARLDATPDVVVLGASHWQEAHAGLLPGRRFYNAHVHRDYYEDMLAVVEMLLRHDRLPPTLIMSIRDLTFQPVERRSDTLWLTALPDYDAMAARLGIARHSWFETRPARRWSGLLSLSAALDNAFLRLMAESLPGPTRARSLPAMDVLLADGSIQWSEEHRERFTAERARREVQQALKERRDQAPQIDPAAVTAIDRLLGLLTEHGVRVILIHPPFNPAFYRQIKDSAYGLGLRQVEAVTARFAAAHGATVVSSFDPAAAGCLESMFIDAEHSGPACLQRVLDQVPGL